MPGSAAHVCKSQFSCRAIGTANAAQTAQNSLALRSSNAVSTKSQGTDSIDELCFATANVSTLYPKELKEPSIRQGCGCTSRTLLLDGMFAMAGIKIACIQEGRLPESGESCCHNYMMYRSGADSHGSGGVQIWVAHQLKKHVTATVARSPWILRVVMSFGEASLHVLSAHAPYEDAPVERRDAFWEALAAELEIPFRASNTFILLGIDGNAHTGSTPSSSIGGHEKQVENMNGAELRATLEEHGMHASNTYFDAGTTWTGSTGLKSRIDYICPSHALHQHVTECYVDLNLDLSTAVREDHNVLICKFERLSQALSAPSGSACGKQMRKPRKPSKPTRYTKESLADPARISYFERLISQFQPTLPCRSGRLDARSAIDDSVSKFNDHVRWAASQCFVAKSSPPRKCWISESTWSVIRSGIDCRNSLRSLRNQHDRVVCSWALHLWRIRMLASVSNQYSDVPSPLSLAKHVNVITDWMLKWSHYLNVQAALTYRALDKFTKIRRPLLKWDRMQSICNIVGDAQDAADRNDGKKLYSLVKGLAGKEASPLRGIRDENGVMITDSSETLQRWRRHFCQLLKASVTHDVAADCADASTAPTIDLARLKFKPTLKQVYRALATLNGDKGLGPDQISADILKAGGWRTAAVVHEIILRAIENEHVPVSWRGGKLVVLYKGKGSPSSCDSYRGLLIGDHISKILTTLLQNELEEPYKLQIGPDQYGATSGRSTALASLALRSFLDCCKLRAWSSFVLFVDLSKAFDFAVREVIMGWMQNAPQDNDDRRDHLVRVGIPEHAVDELLCWLEDRGPLLERMGAPPEVTGLVRSLHTCAWFQLPGDDVRLVTSAGGRQGCKLGALVFNLIYSVALKRIRQKMIDKGVVLHLRRTSDAPFWESHGNGGAWNDTEPEATPVVEVTYVDDEAFKLAASSPRLLVFAIDTLLSELVATFNAFGFHINWGAGKTEAFVTFRGKNSSNEKRKLFIDNDAKIKLPEGAGASHLRVVSEYKHLGSIIGADGGAGSDVPRRVSSAMTSYAPLAVKLFGSAQVSRQVRLALASSLIFSRLLYNAHTWSSWTATMYCKLNAVYMRVLRRIAGACRFDASNKLTDLDVRRRLGAPSMHCLIIRQRLTLLCTVLRDGSTSLKLLLATSGRGIDGEKMPWVRLIRNDLERLYKCNRDKLMDLGSPLENPDAWNVFISSYPAAWKQYVSKLDMDFTEMDGSSRKSKTVCLPLADAKFSCKICAAAGQPTCFTTSKALLSHERQKHRMRNPLRVYLGAACICPACKVQYSTRTRLLAHVSEKRRRGKASTCHEALLSGMYDRLDDNEVQKLDDIDRQLRSAARKSGHTQPLAIAPAKRARRGPACTDAWRPAKRLYVKTAQALVDFVPCKKRKLH